ncbi:MAG: hypothetical protein JRD69_08170 [Deltaproteobacteria bacterium]|nr:hypothetical protein [Deltaproteobacteria bacterium]
MDHREMIDEKWTGILQEIRPACALHTDLKMRFEEAYDVRTEGRLNHEEAARIWGLCTWTFRSYIDCDEESGDEHDFS